jgi:DNA-binding HxlR family transcriptional regulator
LDKIKITLTFVQVLTKKLVMYKTVKENSTNQFNKHGILTKCPITYTLNKIGGRWKPLILYQLSLHEKMRYSELKKSLPSITEKMLAQHLREMEQDKLIIREVMPIIPPHVNYQLSESGKEIQPVLSAMAEWGIQYRNKETLIK